MVDGEQEAVKTNVPDSRSQKPLRQHPMENHTLVFLTAGLVFLFGALTLFGLGGYLLHRMGELGPEIRIIGTGDLSTRDIYNFYGQIIGIFFGPILVFISASICTLVGIRLLRSAGVVSQEIIPERDYDLIASAIREGDDKAVSEYIRLRSLAGITGTFTKIGLTGLPLATIFLTIVLAAIGTVNDKFLDLAQLTLGAFIGSYVQKKGESSENLGSRGA